MHFPSALYAIALFAHIVGVLGMFISMGAQWIILLRLRQARTLSQAREWSGLSGPVGRFGGASGALLVIAGATMMWAAWGFRTAWLDVGLGSMVVMLALSMGLAARRLRVISRALAEAPAEGPIPPALARQIGDPALWVATQTVVAIALGIVFLMTVKPDLTMALLAMGIAVALGLALGLMTANIRHEPRAAAIAPSEAGVR
jgi:hypothetical protein